MRRINKTVLIPFALAVSVSAFYFWSSPAFAQKMPVYPAYDKLVMAGYQGWFAAEGDSTGRGWYHYTSNCEFGPGCATVDFWPDLGEYKKTYPTPFKHPDGTTAYLYSPYDEETVDLHFRWMKEYGIDGVFMQRFVVEIKGDKGKLHFNKVLKNALKAAKRYNRAVSVMYDLSGSKAEDIALIEKDLLDLEKLFSIFNTEKNPTYLHHKNKPLISIWGAGFNDNRAYSTADIGRLVAKLKSKNNLSIMLGVPYYWRTLDKDTEPSDRLHSVIRSCDIVMPWAVGRYNHDTYSQVSRVLPEDLTWCKKNKVDYVPLVFPGFSWGNLKKDSLMYNSIPRRKGDFFWQQVSGAKAARAKALYIAMFDEIDEGTAIFKCLLQSKVPMNGRGKFVGIEERLSPDYYLWLSGKAADWFHNSERLDDTKPKRIDQR